MQLKNLARLYWYTVEFGLIESDEGLRIYGSGIVSSRAESIYSVENRSPNRIRFDLERVMRTDYRIDDFQESYFVIPSFESLFGETYKDFAALYQKLATGPTYKPGDLLAHRRHPHPRHPFLRRRQPRGGVTFLPDEFGGGLRSGGGPPPSRDFVARHLPQSGGGIYAARAASSLARPRSIIATQTIEIP